MGDWDPFAVDDGPPDASGAPGASVAFAPEDLMEVEGVKVKVPRRDFDRAIAEVWKKATQVDLWSKFPDPRPDLGWHKPTCTLESWPHTEVKVELGESIVYITLDRPSANNALNGPMIAALCDALFLLHQRKDIRVVVFTGAGVMFCSGGDPKGEGAGGFTQSAAAPEVQAVRDALAEKALQAGAFPDGKINIGRLLQAHLWHVWSTLPQLTICLANGSAMGDGIGCMACCDITIAVKSAYFVLSDVKVGLVSASISPYIVGRTGNGTAKRIFCTAENMSAEKAKENGLVDEVVDNMADGHKLVQELCQTITACGPRTVEASKQLVYGVAGQQLNEALMFYTCALQATISASEEARQGSAAASASKPKPWEERPIKALH